MKCLKQKIFFDYINNELCKEDINKVKNHLASCEKCQRLYDKHKEQIGLIRKNLMELEPATAPRQPFILPVTLKKHRVKQYFKGKINTLFIPQFVNWRRLIAIPALIILIVSIFVINDKSKLNNNEELQKILFMVESYLDENPKRDWNERSLLITIINEKENTVELVKTSIVDENISRTVIQLDSLGKM